MRLAVRDERFEQSGQDIGWDTKSGIGRSPMDGRVACTNFWPDDDEVVRRAQYRVTSEQVWDIAPKPGSERFLSLAAATLIKAGFKKNVPADLDDHTLRFTGAPRRGFPPHSLFEIFARFLETQL